MYLILYEGMIARDRKVLTSADDPGKEVRPVKGLFYSEKYTPDSVIGQIHKRTGWEPGTGFYYVNLNFTAFVQDLPKILDKQGRVILTDKAKHWSDPRPYKFYIVTAKDKSQ